MHGLINRSIQCLVSDTYGQDIWNEVASLAGTGFESFESLLTYDTAVTEAVLEAAVTRLSTTRNAFLEDLGTYLVSQPRMGAIRRLLRLAGESFEDFLFSLDDLPDRARLAVDDLDFPGLELRLHGYHAYSLFVTSPYPGAGQVFVGALRALADDYGVLALLEHRGRRGRTETISIEVLDDNFAKGRDFNLAVAV